MKRSSPIGSGVDGDSGDSSRSRSRSSSSSSPQIAVNNLMPSSLQRSSKKIHAERCTLHGASHLTT